MSLDNCYRCPWGVPSVLFAILEGTSISLGIKRTEIDGCVHRNGDAYVLVIYDTVPGGAGFTRRLLEGEFLSRSLDAALKRVRECSCGEETSCYGCLRNYQNQYCHGILQRNNVLRVLG